MNWKKRSIRPMAMALAVLLLAGMGAAGAVSVYDAADPDAGLFAVPTAAENNKPIAENLELKTFKDTSVGGVFKAVDPEGEAVGFRLVREPKRGTVEIDGANFVYTPAEGKKGTDSFSYAAVDTAGNVSDEATVTVKITKAGTKVSYADMEGSGAAYAATKLAAEGVYVGRQLGGQWFFDAESTLSRGEFLAMCLSACGVEAAEGVTRTGFADDRETAAWMKPYISTALTGGIVRGYKTEAGALVFSADSPIRATEAAVILDSVLQVTDVAAEEQTELPVWAAQAVANLNACDIVTIGADSYVTRAEAAKMLASAMDLLEARGSSWSLLDWAK